MKKIVFSILILLLTSLVSANWTQEKKNKITNEIQKSMDNWTIEDTSQMLQEAQSSGEYSRTIVTNKGIVRIKIIGETFLLNGKDISGNLGSKITYGDNSPIMGDIKDSHVSFGDKAQHAGRDINIPEPGQKKGGWELVKKISLILGIIVSLIVIVGAYNKYIRKDREQVLITQGFLEKYIGENKHVVELCRRISGLRNVPVSDNGLPALLYPFVISQFNYLGLQTISDIDNTLKKSVDTIAMFAKELNDEMGSISKAECIKILCDFLMPKNRSVDQIIAYYDANSLNLPKERQPYAEKIKRAYQRAIKDI